MILETLLGGLGGGILRLAPELLKVLDAKNERTHELAMGHLSIEADQARAQAQISVENAKADATWDAGALQALIESVKAQATMTGVKWVDAMSSLVRPSITFAFFGLYASCRIAAFIVGVHGGVPVLDLLKATWSAEDQVVLAGILNFWFMGRVFDRASR